MTYVFLPPVYRLERFCAPAALIVTMQMFQPNRFYAVDRPRHCVAMALIFCMGVCSSHCEAAGLIRVSDGRSAYEGKVVALTDSTCSLIDRQGQLLRLPVRSLKSFRKIAPRYRPFDTNELRDSLKTEFGSNYEVAGTTHYLVCGPTGRASRYAELFEAIYRDVEHFYRVRGFPIVAPEVPLQAVVFRTQKEFVSYCLRDQVPPSPGLMGYYSLKTNRVALFDNPSLVSDSGRIHVPAGSVAAMSAISGDTADTIIHETTHQVGYNIGVHSRLGGTPIWIIEGLATVLEPSGMRSNTGRQRLEDRLNAERINWFRKQHRPDRQMGHLAKLVASDAFFHQQTLDSYSESWAFTFFLLENAARRRDLVTYLQTIAERDPAQEYSARDRLSDFQTAFGDISRLEVEFVRYMDRL